MKRTVVQQRKYENMLAYEVIAESGHSVSKDERVSFSFLMIVDVLVRSEDDITWYATSCSLCFGTFCSFAALFRSEQDQSSLTVKGES